jgi:hypothetical protein
MRHSAEYCRKQWIRKSALLKGIFDNIERPIMKWADSQEELERAFSLVYEEYLRAGYIKEPNQYRGVFFNIHNLLPKSRTLIIKCGRDVLATLSMVVDGMEFGLPMDSLYLQEMNLLREKGRKPCEVCSLAVSHKFVSAKLLMPLIRAMYWNAINNQMDDICIMVNPKHVPFYMTILLFESLGPEKFYPRVSAPAVALRMVLRSHKESLKEAYRGVEPEYSVFNYFYEGHSLLPEFGEPLLESNSQQLLTSEIVTYFLKKKKNILKGLLPSQVGFLTDKYPMLL